MFDAVVSRFSPETAGRIRRFRRWRDRQARLFARRLIAVALQWMGEKSDFSGEFETEANGRPVLPKLRKIDFNVSHSGRYVVCAVARRRRIGVDIERIRSIAVSDFRRYLTADEWDSIQNARNPFHRFFSIWTAKESAIKADGRGLSIPLTSVAVCGDRVQTEETGWYIHFVPIDFRYPCCLATSEPISRIHLNFVTTRRIMEG